jgi:hypothetical protein
MNQAKLILVAALVGLSSAAMADTTADRDQRMNSALENYRSSDAAAKNPDPGPFARAEEATKRGARKAGHAIKHGAQRAGDGIATGVEKTGDALRRTGEKIKEKTTPAQ